MTKEEAIEIIECGDISNRWGKDGEEVEKMAIKALKQEPCEDAISRQGVAEVLFKYVHDEVGKAFVEFLVSQINDLPSVNPQKSICPSAGVDCEECPAYEDAISREAAIRIAEQGQIQGYEWQFKELNRLPPVTPQPKSEWQHDHEILKAYSDGANAVLDKIRAEIDEEYDKVHPYDILIAEGLERALDIIDKYIEEGKS